MTATAAFARTEQPLAQPNMQIALLLRFVDETHNCAYIVTRQMRHAALAH